MNVRGYSYTTLYKGAPTTTGSGSAVDLTNSAGVGTRESMLLLTAAGTTGSGAMGTITLWESSASGGTYTAVDTDTIADISADGVQAVPCRVTKEFVKFCFATATTGVNVAAVLIHLKRETG